MAGCLTQRLSALFRRFCFVYGKLALRPPSALIPIEKTITRHCIAALTCLLGLAREITLVHATEENTRPRPWQAS